MGKTPPAKWATLSAGKHPHARGEDMFRPSLPDRRGETPPRTWGRLEVYNDLNSDLGNTPTHVGKTILCRKMCRHCKKHPHARGEDLPKKPRPSRTLETPPRTWGRLEELFKPHRYKGNTPTHVGKTVSELQALCPVRKHPHARGEDSLYPSRVLSKKRNTPTHVGKTEAEDVEHARFMKHPHARGEDACRSPQDRGRRETPPRTWGRPTELVHRPCDGGNTPTHVGKTVLACSIAAPARETPPRTWGRPLLLHMRRYHAGNTPTHVGKTLKLVPNRVQA